MRILVYYSEGREYQDLNNILKAEGHHPLILWADNFKEVNVEFGNAYYITSDVDEEYTYRISKHMEKLGIPLLELQNVPEENNETTDFETLEEAEAYKAELLQEIATVDEIIADFKKATAEQGRLEQEAAEAKALAEKEAEDAKAAALKAEQEKQEAEEAARKAAEAQKLADEAKEDSGNSEETDPLATNEGFEYPTRDNMIMQLREKEVSIPRNATLDQLRPLFDEHVREVE